VLRLFGDVQAVLGLVPNMLFEKKPLIRTDCVSNSLLLKGLFAITGAEQMTGLQQPEEEFPAQAKG